jgi:hypothetical protein
MVVSSEERPTDVTGESGVEVGAIDKHVFNASKWIWHPCLLVFARLRKGANILLCDLRLNSTQVSRLRSFAPICLLLTFTLDQRSSCPRRAEWPIRGDERARLTSMNRIDWRRRALAESGVQSEHDSSRPRFDRRPRRIRVVARHRAGEVRRIRAEIFFGHAAVLGGDEGLHARGAV